VRVGVDGRSLVGGGARGVAHYTGALLEALAAEFPDDEYRVLLPRGRAAVPRGVVPVRHPLPARALFAAAAVAGRPTLASLLPGSDVLWAPAPAPLAVGAAPLVLTVHDRSWEQRPGDFTPYERAWHAAARPRRLARRAARVLTDAEAVRGDLIRAWGLSADRVRAVPLAPRRFPPSSSPPSSFLFVGALEPRKAPDLLVDAFLRARARGLEAELVVVGEGRLDPRGPGVRRLGRVDDLGALYAGALAVVLPSWLEGFGLPPVEGLAAGAPAIVSDLPVFREVLGEGALYVPPGDAEALAEALLSLERDPALRGRLLAAGQARIAPLTWAETARRTRAVLGEAA
jgi:glycosyltransferase involved in cell wall biosynthesis